MTPWSLEVDYFTACNCDWGCPCNFNARPNGGRCYGWGVWRISKGRFGKQLFSSWLPTKFAPIECGVEEGVGRIRIGSLAEAESELLGYPDGSTIRLASRCRTGSNTSRG